MLTFKGSAQRAVALFEIWAVSGRGLTENFKNGGIQAAEDFSSLKCPN
jgi:hypothetical protein